MWYIYIIAYQAKETQLHNRKNQTIKKHLKL